jgi:Tfp pilus assembly protein PilF
MRLLCASAVLLCLCCSLAAAGLPQGTKADVRGQVFLPNGDPAQMVIRVDLSGDDGQTPPQSFYTDSKGRFGMRGLVQGNHYGFVVESDGKNWATSRETVYIAPGAQPFITIHLQPLLASPIPERLSISATELRQTVPPPALRAYKFAVVQLAAGDLAKARKQFERAIELFPDFVEARSELAVVFMRQDSLATAEALLRRALEIDSVAVRPLLNLGLCLYRQQRFAEALPLLARGVQLQPLNPHGNLLYGITLAAASDDAHAEPVLRQAYDQGGKNVALAQLYLSQLYTRQKKYDLAAQALDIYLRDVPAAPDAAALRTTLAKLRAAAQPQP